MSKCAAAGKWIPLMDYAGKKGISLSTLRRHIKANKILYKVENGRYLLLDEGPDDSQLNSRAIGDPKFLELTAKLQRAQKEIAELKTLIALYEETMPSQRLDG
ncbi:MAG: hypothetical protein A2428_07355 [Bdellovibrionales bacterium RIFOXYC1_FULL_54_43]|nr:MAG: hypothetical protein A2428_07355 [Bdellovibrionales bacterium RIFOXYC1_FULL_54_43]OFZ85047.1 MAG: hypothetical protein A2603_07830 [Bdellovibrionales bacterium RIFOXYD1_FULL_55_31]